MTIWDLSKKCKWLNTKKSIIVKYYIKTKEKTHIIISIDAEKLINKFGKVSGHKTKIQKSVM